MKLGERIRAARQKRSVDVTAIAKAAAVSKQAVYQWESGDTKALKGANLVAVAKALDVAPEWLATGRGSMGTFAEPLADYAAQLSAEALEIARAWDKLDGGMRGTVRDLIFYLAATHSVAQWLQIERPRSSRYDSWEEAIQRAYDLEIKQLRLDL